MMKYQVRDAESALAYITDCTLATVADMSMKKSAPKGELRRQITIAQQSIDWMTGFGVDYSKTRAHEVVKECDGLVHVWAARFKP